MAIEIEVEELLELADKFKKLSELREEHGIRIRNKLDDMGKYKTRGLLEGLLPIIEEHSNNLIEVKTENYLNYYSYIKNVIDEFEYVDENLVK